MISHFPSKQLSNPGGYTTFLFVPSQFVETYPMIVDSRTVIPVGLFADVSWLTGYATAETLSFEEEPVIDANGTYYQQTITGFVPGDKADLVNLMLQMPQMRYMVQLRDSLGFRRLLGTPSIPMKFSAKYVSGATRRDQKGFTFTFSGVSMFRAPVYNV